MNLTAPLFVSLVTLATMTASSAPKAAEPLNIEDLQTMSATVEAVDVEKRMVSLRAPDGRTSTLQVSPDVRNLPQMVGSTVTTTVVIHSVDKKNHSVMFSGADGLVRSIPLKRPEAQKFAATLQQGDQVEITYTEALAVNIEEAE